MKKQNSKLAFSLIELSVVILIIGILVIGITKGSRIIRASKLKTAQSLTTSSPVALIDGILIWVESTLDKSFIASEAVDTPFTSEGNLSSWNDISPYTVEPNNASQTTLVNKPRYKVSAINGLPAVNFDGTANPNAENFTYDGTKLAGTNYTVFVLEQRRASDAGWFICGSSLSGNQDLHLGGYAGGTSVYFNQYNNDYVTTVEAYSSPSPKIHSYRFSSTLGKNYYINGVQKSLSPSGSPVGTQGLTAYPGARIGGGGICGGYNGDIGEVIIFTKYLTDTERSNVEKYLKQKWGLR